MRGRCRFCRCTPRKACPGGCSWVNREESLCSSCIVVALAWEAIPVAHMPNMRRAFFRGWATGSGDARADGPVNPYSRGAHTPTWKYWEHGYTAATGRRAAATM
jgi:hypothetical protein